MKPSKEVSSEDLQMPFLKPTTKQTVDTVYGNRNSKPKESDAFIESIVKRELCTPHAFYWIYFAGMLVSYCLS